jgi:lipid II:glycine glycyltransferase (peptidoglycan interpeptide bridge formation enzyme)
MWNLLCWARGNGARWFDLGGVPAEEGEAADAVEGITRFKRNFSTTLVHVGEGWMLEPSPLRASTARVVSRVVRALRHTSS